MPPEYSRIWPFIAAALVILAIYRRFRRNFGRQLLRPTRMTIRIVILLALAAALAFAPAAPSGGDTLLAEILGAAVGVALALWGASRTRFVRDGGRLFYVPHTYTGLAVSALLLGRIVYRFGESLAAGGFGPPGAQAPDPHSAMVKTPLTIGLFFVLIGYYVGYFGWILWKSRRITPADLEASSTPSSSAPNALS